MSIYKINKKALTNRVIVRNKSTMGFISKLLVHIVEYVSVQFGNIAFAMLKLDILMERYKDTNKDKNKDTNKDKNKNTGKVTTGDRTEQI